MCAYGACPPLSVLPLPPCTRTHVNAARRSLCTRALAPVAANNQWKLGEELVDDLALTSFRKALQQAEGTLSILDRNGTVFTRVWCCYEVRRAAYSGGLCTHSPGVPFVRADQRVAQ